MEEFAMRRTGCLAQVAVWLLSSVSVSCSVGTKGSGALAGAGARVYAESCAACHGATGEGTQGMGSPLVGSEWVSGSDQRLVLITLNGVRGPMRDGERASPLVMPGFGAAYDDDTVAAVLTYVRQAWSSGGALVTAATVRQIRSAATDREEPWTVKELLELDGE